MKVKDILKNAAYGILRSYEGMRFWPSFLSKLLMALVAATVTAFFAGTLFSRHNAANQIFSALFFYCLIAAVSKLITEIKRGGAGKRLKATLSSMVHLKPPALWFFLAAVGLALLLPYAFVLALGLLLGRCAVALGDQLGNIHRGLFIFRIEFSLIHGFPHFLTARPSRRSASFWGAPAAGNSC